MIILDTDHINELQNSRGETFRNLSAKMAISLDQRFVTTVITFEEQMRGWLALIHRSNSPSRQVSAYTNLNNMVDFYSSWLRLPFDDRAAQQFQYFRGQKVRIGTMDLRIASIAYVHNCLLLSANLRDFGQVPNLQVEDWIHS